MYWIEKDMSATNIINQSITSLYCNKWLKVAFEKLLAQWFTYYIKIA